MIVDLRQYTLRPGQLGPYLDRYGRDGYGLQTRHLGPALGWFVVDVGTQNQVIQLWRYRDAADLERRRAARASDPDWTAFRDGLKGLFARQETRHLLPVPGLALTSAQERPALVDIRTYILSHGELGRFLGLYRDHGAAVHRQYWPDSLGYFQSAVGLQNQVVHLWGHVDHAERLDRRRRLLDDPDWQAYLREVLPLFAEMANTTAVPAPFWRRAPDKA